MTVSPNAQRPTPNAPCHIHFIGIGGVGMSGLAQVMLSRGHQVSGSDPHENAATERLRAAGARIYASQVPANIEMENPSLVVATAAIAEANPELQAARAAGIRVVSRAEFLGEVMAEHRGPRIAVTGTHGKTTTTAMIASVLLETGLDPTVLVGGEVPAIGGNARVGRGEVFLTEACEAYDSFLSLKPDLAVVTNVEADHLDYYGTERRLRESFRQFLRQVSPGGTIAWCCDDPGARDLVASMADVLSNRRLVGYGRTAGPGERFLAGNEESAAGATRFTVSHQPATGEVRYLGGITIRTPGGHNVLNALAAAAASLCAGINFAHIARGLESYTGTGRRFEMLGERRGILVIDDYAHHPTEIRATLSSARAAYPDRRILAVFQPHLYSRTRDFLQEFADALAEADMVVVSDVYAARENPIPGVRASDIVRLVAEREPEKTVLYARTLGDVVEAIRWLARPGDLVLTLGAGDICEAAYTYIAAEDSANG